MTTVETFARSATMSLSAMVRRLISWNTVRRLRARTRTELMNLTDRELLDIGVSRFQINDIVSSINSDSYGKEI